MQIELTKEHFVDMLNGTSPYYSYFEECTKYGSYSDQSGWKWDKTKLHELSEGKLYELYLGSKKSWEN